MTSPYILESAKRAGILAPKQDPFIWMNEPIYIPADAPHITRKRSRARVVFGVLMMLAVVVGALAALSH